MWLVARERAQTEKNLGKRSIEGGFIMRGLFYREGIVVIWKVDAHLSYNIARGIRY